MKCDTLVAFKDKFLPTFSQLQIVGIYFDDLFIFFTHILPHPLPSVQLQPLMGKILSFFCLYQPIINPLFTAEREKFYRGGII
jgi:hypothetical protein